MDIKKLNEEIKHLYEDVTQENEAAELRRIKRVYLKALDGLEQLQTELEYSVEPGTGKMDKDTQQFYDLLTKCVNEIYSRSLAFDN